MMKVLDHTAALARVGGDLELLREIAVLFEAECPRVLGELRRAIERGDAEAASRAAHGLKGSASNFGAAPAVDAAQRIEQLAREDRIQDARGDYEALERAVTTLVGELKLV
jgi:HPt (histidine-containing phosphotransfer) domain-containing protein